MEHVILLLGWNSVLSPSTQQIDENNKELLYQYHGELGGVALLPRHTSDETLVNGTCKSNNRRKT